MDRTYEWTSISKTIGFYPFSWFRRLGMGVLLFNLVKEVTTMSNNSDTESHTGVWITVLIVFIIACVIYNVAQNNAKNDYQNAQDWTACRRDYKNGLATMDECNQVRRNDSVYVPR